jgi:hypothetical protein
MNTYDAFILLSSGEIHMHKCSGETPAEARQHAEAIIAQMRGAGLAEYRTAIVLGEPRPTDEQTYDEDLTQPGFEDLDGDDYLKPDGALIPIHTIGAALFYYDGLSILTHRAPTGEPSMRRRDCEVYDERDVDGWPDMGDELREAVKTEAKAALIRLRYA